MVVNEFFVENKSLFNTFTADVFLKNARFSNEKKNFEILNEIRRSRQIFKWNKHLESDFTLNVF